MVAARMIGIICETIGVVVGMGSELFVVVDVVVVKAF
jgi:hypothetical protein